MSKLGLRTSTDPYSTAELAELKGRIEHILPAASDDGHCTLARLVKWYLIEAQIVADERDKLKEQLNAE